MQFTQPIEHSIQFSGGRSSADSRIAVFGGGIGQHAEATALYVRHSRARLM